jgi:hypothetical protein
MKKKETIFHLLEKYGLDISAKSGGSLIPTSKIEFSSKEPETSLTLDSDTKIKFYDASLFLESIKTTEKALKLKLFV